jgi:hypothetical protein
LKKIQILRVAKISLQIAPKTTQITTLKNRLDADAIGVETQSPQPYPLPNDLPQKPHF